VNRVSVRKTSLATSKGNGVRCGTTSHLPLVYVDTILMHAMKRSSQGMWGAML
jgi:hypothetical protein